MLDHKWLKYLEILFILAIPLLAISFSVNGDFYYHLAWGRYIWQTKSIPTTDVFSFPGLGRPIILQEWLFELLAYSLYSFGGYLLISVLVYLSQLCFLLIFRMILINMFNVGTIKRTLIIGFLSVSTYSFWVERPQIAAYLFFIILVYIILLRIFKDKNYLFLSIPMVLLWINTHASAVLLLYLLISFGLIYLFLYIRKKKKSDLLGLRDFWGYGLICFLLALLPPIGLLKIIQFLSIFAAKREFISTTIEEFIPIQNFLLAFWVYFAVIILSFVAFIIGWRKKHEKYGYYFLVSFIPLSLFAFTGVRQVAFAVPSLIILSAPLLSRLKIGINKNIKYLILILSFGATFILLYLYRIQARELLRPYPSEAIPFIKENLSGHMFNELNIGGYLNYELGTKRPTFINGQVAQQKFFYELLPDYVALGDMAGRVLDSELVSYFNSLVNKYDISWVILTTKPFTFWRKIAAGIENSGKWHLVFFDDTDEIYVRDDGKNSGTIKSFAVMAATPFEDKIYITGKRDMARNEYERMNVVVPSAVSNNALGYMLLEDKKYAEARNYFKEALKINSEATSPMMNMAEIDAYDGNYTEGIKLYRRALNNDFEKKRGFGYIRLGQLIIASGGSKDDAVKVWQEGIQNTIYRDVKDRLNQLINGI